MTAREIFNGYSDLSQDKKISLLLYMIHYFTICGRAMSLPQIADNAARGKLLGINELIHVVSSQLMHMADNDEDRYPDSVFIDVLFETAGIRSCENELYQAINWSYDQCEGLTRTVE